MKAVRARRSDVSFMLAGIVFGVSYCGASGSGMYYEASGSTVHNCRVGKIGIELYDL